MSRIGGMLAGSLLILSSLQMGAAAESGKTWMTYGGDAANTRFSPLTQINRSNVARLKVAWVAQLGSLEAQESTPLVVGDTLFVTTSAGPRYVYALHAKDGTPKWKYAPEIRADVQQKTCCGLDNIARSAAIEGSPIRNSARARGDSSTISPARCRK